MSQLRSNVGGVSDPFVDVSRTVQRVSTGALHTQALTRLGRGRPPTAWCRIAG